ncbi:MAG: leucyl aminopeptidase [Mycolicibacterium sp.]|nr:leucyl aminopeptidase [Mycolicibacterium sp.]
MSTESDRQSPAVTVAATLSDAVSATDTRDPQPRALVVGIVAGEDGGPAVVLANPFLDAEATGEIESQLRALGAKTGPEQVTRVVVPSLPFEQVLAVGVGRSAEDLSADLVRRCSGAAARAASGVPVLVTALADVDVAAAVEGTVLGGYRFAEFRSAKTAPTDPALNTVVALSVAADAEATANRAALVADAVATARDLVNTPPNALFPKSFAKRARKLGEAAGLEVEVLGVEELEKEGFGGILAVGQGSTRAPRLVRLRHKGAKGGKKVALVGKGVTFDTGGISIKPAASMHHMTSDMGGAAAVIATVVLAARLKLPIDVTATVPMAENMPSGSAQRPGDVLTQYGGTTVEVLNTDAEGRLILADAIVRACEDSPDYLIETSTLTGAQLIALGARIPGVMGSDDFRDRVAARSADVGENAWPMPLPDELKDDLKSRVADLANVSGQRFAGMLVAGVYLREFVADGVDWVHIDIAGPSYNTGSAWGYTPKGGTGVPVRTMLAVLEDIASNG